MSREVLAFQTEEVTRQVTATHTHPLVNPAVRVGWNGPGGVQWVLGLGVPIGFGRAAGQLGILLYFSIEHAITATARRTREWQFARCDAGSDSTPGRKANEFLFDIKRYDLRQVVAEIARHRERDAVF